MRWQVWLALALTSALAPGCEDDPSLYSPGSLWEPVPAYGITITDLSINQGVQVELADDGALLEPSSPVLSARDTLLRAHWQVLETDEPHPFRARLRVDRSGEVTELPIIRTHSASPAGYFQWIVPADLVGPDTRVEIDLLEDPDSRSEPFDDYDPPPRFPAQGSASLGVGPDVELEVWLVPIDYAVDGCQRSASLRADELRAIEEKLIGLSPISSLKLRVRDSIPFDQGLKSWTPFLVHLSQWRVEHEVPPHVYVVGLLDACRTSIGSHRGHALALVDDPGPEMGFARVAGVLLADDDYTFTPDLLAHELGHLMGRAHATCKGIESKPDPDYPQPDGSIGVEGFDVVEHYAWSAAAPDVMSYCRPAWISAYGWNATHAMLSAVAQWGRAAPGEPARVGARVVDEHGDTYSWVVNGPGPLSARSVRTPYEGGRLELGTP